jgi:hypothetical protein
MLHFRKIRMSPFRRKYTAPLLIFTALGPIVALLPPTAPVVLRVFLAAAYLLGTASCIGRAVVPRENAPWRLFLGTLIAVATLAALGAAVYFLVSLAPLLRAAVLAAAPLLAAHLAALGAPSDIERTLTLSPQDQVEPRNSATALSLVSAGIAVALAGAAVALAVSSSTGMALRTPWDAVPPRWFLLVFFAAASAVAAALAGAAAPVAFAAIGSAILSVGATVYAAGFGFDPFIHRAAERIIVAEGVLLPKTLYYLGQYALVTFAAVGGAPVDLADKFLLPALFAFAPFMAYWSLRRGTGASPAAAAVGSAVTLLIPLAPFAATTPQGVADLFALLTVFAALPASNGSLPKGAFLMLAAATAAVHPIAGVPVAVFAVIVLLLSQDRPSNAGAFLAAKVAIIGALVLPATFVANALLSDAGVQIDGTLLHAPSAIIEDLQRPQTFSRRFDAVFDVAYAWRDWRAFVLIAAAAAGVFLARRRPSSWAFAAGASVVAVDYVLLSSVIRFPFLIDYERTNYADRLGDLALIVLAPPAAYALAKLVERMRTHGFPAMRVALTVVLAATVTSSAYLAYPRRDQYDTSRGWSTSESDAKAVLDISKDADGMPYVVLANQSVAAAAIDRFGFAKYYDAETKEFTGKVFFYPIPTGGPLYRLYLEMNDARGDADVARKAMELAGTKLAYFVVNDYWWDAQRIIVSARRAADGWWSVDGHVYVFRYKR